LPITEHLAYGADQVQQNVYLVDRLIDERPAALGGPTSLDRPCIISFRAKPLHVSVGLKNLAETPFIESTAQEKSRVVEAMLTYHVQQNARLVRDVDHLSRGFEIRRDRLLHLYVLLRFSTDFNGLEAEIGERADIDNVHFRVAAEFFIRCDEFAAMQIGELAAGRSVNIRADGQLEPDVFVGFRMFVRDRTRANDSDSHDLPSKKISRFQETNEPSGNRRRGSGGTARPYRRCQRVQLSRVNTPGGVSASTLRNSASRALYHTAFRATCSNSAGYGVANDDMFDAGRGISDYPTKPLFVPQMATSRPSSRNIAAFTASALLASSADGA